MDKISISHSCGDSGLKCVDCAGQICPKCMVQCAVGNRCKNCTSRFTSHVLKTSPVILLRLAAAMAALGVAYGYLQAKIQSLPMGFYGYIIAFFIFAAVGRMMQRVASYKQGPKIMLAAIGGLIAGLLIGPFRAALLRAIMPQADDDGTGDILIQATIFVVAVLWPFMRRG